MRFTPELAEEARRFLLLGAVVVAEGPVVVVVAAADIAAAVGGGADDAVAGVHHPASIDLNRRSYYYCCCCHCYDDAANTDLVLFHRLFLLPFLLLVHHVPLDLVLHPGVVHVLPLDLVLHPDVVHAQYHHDRPDDKDRHRIHHHHNPDTPWAHWVHRNTESDPASCQDEDRAFGTFVGTSDWPFAGPSCVVHIPEQVLVVASPFAGYNSQPAFVAYRTAFAFLDVAVVPWVHRLVDLVVAGEDHHYRRVVAVVLAQHSIHHPRLRLTYQLHHPSRAKLYHS